MYFLKFEPTFCDLIVKRLDSRMMLMMLYARREEEGGHSCHCRRTALRFGMLRKVSASLWPDACELKSYFT
jgi:hypothetical protein